MNTADLLDQFILEARECLEQIGKRLLDVERQPGDEALLNDLFRQVHTLKGNCGLFEFKALERVVHAGEDLLDRVRLIPTDAIPPGDMRISWRAGSVRRDTAGLWADIENILAPAGLLSPAVRATITRKETENVE